MSKWEQVPLPERQTRIRSTKYSWDQAVVGDSTKVTCKPEDRARLRRSMLSSANRWSRLHCDSARWVADYELDGVRIWRRA